MITLRLPIDPVPAARPKFGKGFTYTPRHYREFQQIAHLLIHDRYDGKPLEGPIEVCIVFTVTKPKSVKNRDYPCVKPDIDNFVKAIFDSGNLLLWKDDAQIVDLHTFKRYGEPSITITVKQMGEEQ